MSSAPQYWVDPKAYTSKKILLLEDVPIHQANFIARMQSIFPPDLVHIYAVVGSDAAIALLNANIQFDLIVLDHDMPYGTGSDFVSYLNEKSIDVPILTFSGRMEANAQMAANYKGRITNFIKHDVIVGRANDVIKSYLGM